MLKRIGIITLLFMFIFGASCWARTPDEARTLLVQSNTKYDFTTFLTKIQENDNYFVSLFIDSGFDVNQQAEYGNTPLKIAAIYNNVEATKLLLNVPNINVNLKSDTDKSAIDVAYLFGNDEIVKLLKEKSAELSVPKTNRISDEYKKSAIEAGKKIAANKQELLFVEKEEYTDKSHGRFPGPKKQLMDQAYWVTPFCAVANESLNANKKYEQLKDNTIKLLSNTYQAKMIFNLTNDNKEYFSDAKIIAIQNGRIIRPYKVDFIPTQVTKKPGLFAVMLYRTGLVASFNAYDINPNESIEVKLIGKPSKEVTYKFKNNNPTDFYKSESGELK